MIEFKEISIPEISKEDMLMIIEALEFTGEKTKIEDFINLRNNIVEDLCSLSEASEDEFLAYLNK